MKLVQCWDDGVTTDVRLVSLLRHHGARATFNLNAGLHASQRQLGWHHLGTEVWRLGRDELREVYDGFSVANHTLTHPHLEQLPIEAARREIRDGRACLQALFDQPVSGFVYPFGTFDDAVVQAVRDAGHLYARTTRAAQAGVDTIDAMAAAPSCHFLAPDFWQRFDRARSTSSWRSAVFNGNPPAFMPELASPCWPTQVLMLSAWQPNSLASSMGLRPAWTSSTICWRNCAGYDAFDFGIRGILLPLGMAPAKSRQLRLVTS